MERPHGRELRPPASSRGSEHLESKSSPSQAFRWHQPQPTSPATSWDTLSESHLAKPLQVSWPSETIWDNKGLLFKSTTLEVTVAQQYVTNTLPLLENFCWPQHSACPLPQTYYILTYLLLCQSSFSDNEFKDRHWYYPWIWIPRI